jgi:nicotinamidase-related amidase
MLAVMLRSPGHLEVGSPAAQVVAELGPHASDIVSSRRHGVSPFTGTDLDSTLRNLGVGTIVATGVSLNLGVLGLAIEAVNLGYRVAVVTDAVAGVPRDYGRAVMANTVALLATRVDVDDLIGAWKA